MQTIKQRIRISPVNPNGSITKGIRLDVKLVSDVKAKLGKRHGRPGKFNRLVIDLLHGWLQQQ